MLKRVFSIIITTAIIFTILDFNSLSVQANECDIRGYHDWSSWYEYEPSCSEPGKRTRYCYDCGLEEEEIIPAYGHKWGKWTILKKATSYHKGRKERYCQECYKDEVKSIPKRPITKNEKKAKKVVNNFLNYSRNYKYKKIKKCFHSNKGYKLYKDPTMVRCFRKHNKKMKWKIKDITGKGSKIRVKVRVKVANLYQPAYNALFKASKEYVDGGVSDKAMVKKMENYYRNGIVKAKRKTKTKTYTFTVVKKHGKWKIRKRTGAVQDIAMGRYYEGTQDAAISAGFYILITKG